MDYRLKIQDFQRVVYNKSKILVYRSDNPSFFELIIQDFQNQVEKLGLSIETPRLSSQKLGLSPKILDCQLKVQVIFENLELSIENLGFSTDIPRCWSKIQDFRLIRHQANHTHV